MTIPACDYDTILATQPTTWRDRGLHYHAYAWRGDGRAMQENEQARNDPGSDAPPLTVRDWLRKPQRLLSAAHATPEDAAAWLRTEYERIAPQLAGDHMGVDERMRIKVYDLRCGNNVVMVEWLRGGAMVHLAVLSVTRHECDRHG